MDLASFRRGIQAWGRRQPARPDYRILVATLEAMQSASPAARALRSARVSDDAQPRHDGLVALLLGEPAWRAAVTAQGGCFHRGAAAHAAQRRKPK